MDILVARFPALTAADVTGNRLESALCPRLHPRCHVPDLRLPSRPHPLRPQPHRLPAYRRRAHRAVLLGLRPPPRRQLHPAHRGHRRRPLHPRGGAGHPRRHALAGAGARRGPVLPDAAHGPVQGGHRPDAGRRHRLPLLHVVRRARPHPRRAARAWREAALRRALAPGSGQDPAAAARRRAAGGAFPQSGRRRGGLGRPRQGPHRDRQRRDGRLHHRARRRHADLQLLRGGGRLGHGHHPRHPRRRPREQHPAPDQRAAGARRRGAAVRPPVDDPRRRRHQALQAPRRGERDAVRRGWLPARGGHQLPRAPGLEPRRR